MADTTTSATAVTAPHRRTKWTVIVAASVLLPATGSLLVSLGTPGRAPAAPDPPAMLKVAASDDTYTSTARPNQNFAEMKHLASGRFVDGDTKSAYLKFRIDALPPATTVAGAQLTLSVDGRAATSPVQLSQLPDTSWAESTLTAARAPATGPPVASLTPATGTTTITFDVGTVITGPGLYAFVLTSAATDAVTQFYSTEHGDDGPTLSLRLNHCVLDAKLVPSCHILWGAAAGGFSTTPRDEALKQWEAASERTATIFHTYHQGDELFPTKDEIAMTRDPSNPRILMTNWKVAAQTTWARVARGEQDKRIDRLAGYLKANFTDRFFMIIHHEPENDVNPAAGSGMTAADFAAMFRHTVARLRAAGITNAVFVVAYMGNEKWMSQPWWKDLYPGDNAVDWIGLDSYVNAEPGSYHYGTFGAIVDRGPTTGGPGFYTWATTSHASKPFMLAEWGVYHSLSRTVDKGTIYDTVLPELSKHPAIKAIVYFDTTRDATGDRNITIEDSNTTLTAFQGLAANPVFTVDLPSSATPDRPTPTSNR